VSFSAGHATNGALLEENDSGNDPPDKSDVNEQVQQIRRITEAGYCH
jgi:hypothetical protein